MKNWKSAERQVAFLLQEWSGIPLIRTPQSGGGITFPGDIVPRHESDYQKWPFVVEVKTRQSFSVYSLLYGECPWFVSWWRQLEEEVGRRNESGGQGYIPLLVMKESRRPYMCALRDFPRDMSIGYLYVYVNDGLTSDGITIIPLATLMSFSFQEVVKWLR